MTDLDLDARIVAMVKDRDVSETDIIEALTKDGKVTERIVRERLGRLDGRTIKRVQEGDWVWVASMERWRGLERLYREVQVAHTRKLKVVLDLFRTQIPSVDVFGPFLAGGTYDTSLFGALRFVYAPDQALEFERHVLWEDLLDHLARIGLPVNPSEAWRSYKENISLFLVAGETLWEMCAEAASREFNLPVGRNWSEAQVSEHCVALLHRQAFAAAKGDRPELERLRGETSVQIRETEGFLEYWRGGLGLVRQKASRAGDKDAFRRWADRSFGQIYKTVESGPFLRAGRDLWERLRYLKSFRKNLVRALEEATYFEVFPGPCRFTASER